MDIRFIDFKHKEFFVERASKDVYHNALFYLLGLCPETRRHYTDLYDDSGKCIKPEGIGAGWQTGTSVKVTRLAFNLFSDGTPTAVRYNDDGSSMPYNRDDYNECSLYSVSDVFCCEYAPYYYEAIKPRYPEYAGNAAMEKN